MIKNHLLILLIGKCVIKQANYTKRINFYDLLTKHFYTQRIRLGIIENLTEHIG